MNVALVLWSGVDGFEREEMHAREGFLGGSGQSELSVAAVWMHAKPLQFVSRLRENYVRTDRRIDTDTRSMAKHARSELHSPDIADVFEQWR